MSSFGIRKSNSAIVSSGNYFFYADASNNWTLSGNNIYNNNTGNVGINTSTPLAQLDVNGSTIIRTPLVDIGVNAGQTLQKTGSIAIGTSAGENNLGSFAVAIGSNAGRIGCGASNVSVGWLAGEISSGGGSVAIGNRANQLSTQNRQFGVYIGEFAGGTFAGQGAIAIGLRSGGTNQSTQAVAIGYNTAQNNQGQRAIAIGRSCGDVSQGEFSVAIGSNAASANQGTNSVCIGTSSGSTFQNSIVLNASGSTFVSDISNGFFVRPIDVSTGTTNLLVYNSSSGKISYNTTKTFVIDHPIDENKYLVHACLEGPEAGVYYRGEAEITNNEFVEVVLPEYTNAFSNFTVHVSPAGSFNNLYASQVENGKFHVFGKNGKVSWTVFATRENINTEPMKDQVSVSGFGPYKYIN
jgi:hypothetical protein